MRCVSITALAVSILCAVAHAIPLDNDRGGASRSQVRHKKINGQMERELSSSAFGPSDSAPDYWIDEFGNTIPLTTSASTSSSWTWPFGHRREALRSQQEQQLHDPEFPFESAASNADDDDNKPNLFRTRFSGYHEFITRYGGSVDLDQQYIHGFFYGVAALLLFSAIGALSYLVAGQLLFSAWKTRVAPRVTVVRGQQQQKQQQLKRGGQLHHAV